MYHFHILFIQFLLETSSYTFSALTYSNEVKYHKGKHNSSLNHIFSSSYLLKISFTKYEGGDIFNTSLSKLSKNKPKRNMKRYQN